VAKSVLFCFVGRQLPNIENHWSRAVIPNLGAAAHKGALKMCQIFALLSFCLFYCLGCLRLSFKGRLECRQIIFVAVKPKRLKNTGLEKRSNMGIFLLILNKPTISTSVNNASVTKASKKLILFFEAWR